jgi:dihydrofolate reductase
MKNVNAIIAYDRNYGIGKNGKLSWPHHSEDMKWFRECTNGHVIIMGRKTWESIGSRKLPNRINVVVSNSSNIEGNPDSIYSGDISLLLAQKAEEYKHLKLWIIGGADLYKQSLQYCNNIYTTRFTNDYSCDTFVPMDVYLSGYTELAKRSHNDATFSIWSRV